MGARKKPTRSQRKTQKVAQWVTFLVLFSFVMGSVIIGGLSFRSGRIAQTPSSNRSPQAAQPGGDTSGSGDDPVHRWQEAVKLNPKDPWALRNFSRALLNAGKFSEARKAADEALKLSPADVLNLELLGEVAEREGKVEEAVAYLKKAVGSLPKDSRLLFELAQLLSRSGKDEESRSYYEKVISIHPDSAEGVGSRLALLNLAMYEKKFDEAEKQAFALYKLAPGDPHVLIKIGEIEEEENKLADALSYYERARQAQPDNLPLLSHLAEVYAKNGNNAEASALWLQVIQKNKDDPEPKVELALLDKKQGKKGEAEDLLERAMREAETEKNAPLKEKIAKLLQSL